MLSELARQDGCSMCSILLHSPLHKSDLCKPSYEGEAKGSLLKKQKDSSPDFLPFGQSLIFDGDPNFPIEGSSITLYPSHNPPCQASAQPKVSATSSHTTRQRKIQTRHLRVSSSLRFSFALGALSHPKHWLLYRSIGQPLRSLFGHTLPYPKKLLSMVSKPKT